MINPARRPRPPSAFSAALGAAVMFLATAHCLRAAIWIGLDLDTLTAKSDLIFEGPIISIKDAASELVEVHVTHLYRGDSIKENDTLLVKCDVYTGANIYTKPAGQLMNTVPLEIGDQLFWFLSKQDQARRSTAQPGVWYPFAGGLKLVYNNHVAEFSQHYSNPGPIAAEIEPEFAKNQPTTAEYRKQIEASLKASQTFQPDLQAAIDARDSHKIVELLRQRAAITAQRPEGIDQLSDDAAKALCALHDYAALDDAMNIPALHGGRQFARGFATLEGIQYLLAKITDTKLPSVKRIAYINVLPAPTFLKSAGRSIIRPDHYLLGIANLAVDNIEDHPLSQSLLGVLGGWARFKSNLDDAARADLSDALVPLTALYHASQDSSVQVPIELIIWRADPDAYGKLGSPCGPVISRAYIPSLDHIQKPAGRDFVISVSLAYCFPDQRDHSVQNEPVLESADGTPHVAAYVKSPGNTFDPSTFTMNTGSDSGFSCAVNPPSDLPAGKYRLYFNFRESGVLLGRSHSVEITLPQP